MLMNKATEWNKDCGICLITLTLYLEYFLNQIFDFEMIILSVMKEDF